MLTHPTLEQMHALGLTGMAAAYRQLAEQDNAADLSRDEWLGLMLDRETAMRADQASDQSPGRGQVALRRGLYRRHRLRCPTRARSAQYLAASARRLAESAGELDHHRPDRHRQNLALLRLRTPSGKARSFCPLFAGAAAVRKSRHGPPRRPLPRLVDKLARVQLLILDDWGTHSLNDQQRLDLLEIFEERYRRKSTLIAAQLPVVQWHDMIGEPTIADAILDRIVHNAHRVNLEGDSLRKRKSTPHLTDAQNSETNPT